MERVKYNKVEVCHGDSQKKFPVYEIYLDGVIVTKVSSESDALELSLIHISEPTRRS